MPTKQERTTVAKLILVVLNVMDENRKEIEYDETEPHPEYTLEQLRPMAKEALEDAQAMLASWGGK